MSREAEQGKDWPSPGAAVFPSRINVGAGYFCEHEFGHEIDDEGLRKEEFSDYRATVNIFLDRKITLVARLIWDHGKVILEEFGASGEVQERDFATDIDTAEDACELILDELTRDDEFLNSQRDRYLKGREDGDHNQGQGGGAG